MTILTVQVGVTLGQAYGAIMMLSVAGAMFLTSKIPRVATLLFCLWFIYFTAAWVIDPLRNADRLHLPTISIGIAWFAALILAVVASKDRLTAANDHAVLWQR